MPQKTEKKYSYLQHIKRMQKEKEKEVKIEENKKIGTCAVCGCGGFTLRCEGRKLARTCKNEECQDTQYF